MYDPSPGILAQLEPDTRLRAVYLLNAFRAAGIPLMATSGRRSVAEQFSLVWAGKSRSFTSAHLSGRAFDVDVAGWSRDALPLAFWQILGPYGEALGLRWGGRWQSFVDRGHFEAP